MHDLVIRGGVAVYGIGEKPFLVDVAIDGSMISALDAINTHSHNALPGAGVHAWDGLEKNGIINVNMAGFRSTVTIQ